MTPAAGSVVSGVRGWSSAGLEVLFRPSTLTALSAVATGLVGLRHYPFAADDVFLSAIASRSPRLYEALKDVYPALWFSTPWLAYRGATDVARRVFGLGQPSSKASVRPPVPRERLLALRAAVGNIDLPPYITPAEREALYVILGEWHRTEELGPTEDADWIEQLPSGLYTGMIAFGGTGTGKTRAFMRAIAKQLFGYKASDPVRRIGGLVMGAKSDVCEGVRNDLKEVGRGEDLLEWGPRADVRYNCLRDGDAEEKSYFLATLAANIFGRSKDPFWPSAAKNCIKFVILAHRLLYDYVTLENVYDAVIDEETIGALVSAGEKRFARKEFVQIEPPMYADHAKDLSDFGFTFEQATKCMQAVVTPKLKEALIRCGVVYRCVPEPLPPGVDPEKAFQFVAVKQWYEKDWLGLTPQLRRSIVEGITVHLSVFKSDPVVNRICCPPKEAYDPKLNVKDANGNYKYGRVLESLSSLIEWGKVLCVNFPVGENENLAKLLGTLMKLDFERAILNRVALMAAEPTKHFREAVFMCDEYQWFATSSGTSALDDKGTFAMSRQSKLIPIVATQSVSMLASVIPEKPALDALLQTFGTKVFLRSDCSQTLKYFEELVGTEYRWVASHGASVVGQGAAVSTVSGAMSADGGQNVTQSRTYQRREEARFRTTDLLELPTAVSIVCLNDGMHKHAPRFCYLKPYDLDPQVSWWDHYVAGRIVRDERPKELRR